MREMKDSGIIFVGKIPKDWRITKVKRLFNIGRGRVIATTKLHDSGFPVYSSQTKNNGVLGYIDTFDYDRSQLTWTTDGANAGTVFLREGKHNCTNVCGTLMPINSENNLRYLYYVLSFIATYHKRADINGFKIMNNEMAEIEILIPPLSEQNQIADFLDSEYARIDAVIEQTRASIEEYKKLKQSVITEAVTKGIRGDRPMKDSGIKWIGEIPNAWEVIISRFVIDNIGDVDHYMPESVETGFPYIMTGDLKESLSDIYFEKCKKISSGDYVTLSQKIHPLKGDIIFARYATIGTVCYVDCDTECVVSYSCVTVQPSKDKLNGKYLFYYFKSQTFQEEVQQYITSNTQANVGIEAMYRSKIVVPPIDEQKEIVEYLDNKSIEIYKLIRSKEQLLIELENYKKSLIFEYVTGKKEV